MDINWTDAETFLAVAETGSVSAGAVHLGLGQPTVSRRLAQLEARMECALFVRDKRGARLTEAGARLLPAAEQMARWAAEFERLASGAEDRPEGLVRIAAPPALAVDLLAPFAAELSSLLPAIRLEVRAGVEHLDLVRGEADLAIRTRAPNEPELISLGSGESKIGVFASAAYRETVLAESRTTPNSETVALDELEWITWSDSMRHVPPRPMLERAIPDFAAVFAADDLLVQRAAAQAGLGAILLDVEGAQAAGLVEIDVGFAPPPNRFHVVCARSMQYVPRIRAVAEKLLERAEIETAEEP